MIHVRIDQDKCIGCGLCEELLPEVFSMGRYRCRVIQAEIRPGQEEAAVAAAEDCPLGAIYFTDGGDLPESPPGNHDDKSDREK